MYFNEIWKGAVTLVLLLLSKPVQKPCFFCKTEPKPRFYASVLTVRFWIGAAVVSWLQPASRLAHSSPWWVLLLGSKVRSQAAAALDPACEDRRRLKVSLNEALFVAGTLVMHSWKWHAIYLVSWLAGCLIHRPTRYSYSAGFGAHACRLWKWLERTYWSLRIRPTAASVASLGHVQWCASPTRSSLSDSKPNRNRPTLASMKL